MSEPRIRALNSAVVRTGESPVWDAASKRLYWIDNVERTILRCTADGSDLQTWQYPSRITAIAPAGDDAVVVASGRRVTSFDLTNSEAVELTNADTRAPTPFNDAKVDRHGSFVVGTVDPSLFDAGRPALDRAIDPTGELLRLGPDGALTSVAGKVGITNGPCFSVDGTTMFYNDSWSRTTYAIVYDPVAGRVIERRTFAEFEPGVIPDGATVDAEDHLWVVCYGAGELRRIRPDGSLDRRISLPVHNPTSVMFGGADLDLLFVTTEGSGRDPSRQPSGPLDGTVLVIEGVGVRGVPERRFGQSGGQREPS